MHNAQCTIEVSAFGGQIGSFALRNLAVSFADKPHIGLIWVAKMLIIGDIVGVKGRMAISSPKAIQ